MVSSDRKTILRQIPYGLYIMTARLAGDPVATVVSFVSQTSLKPPLIMTALKVNSTIYQAVTEQRCYALHFIDRDRKHMVADFFKLKTFNAHQINGYYYENSAYDLPLLRDSPMIIEAELREIIEIGDHHPVISEIVTTHFRRDTEILTMEHTNWHYGG
ncbi:MAG: flavin reductase [Candidatus Marinimicrobia bacterium]|nr:flavin reductase [Candidatus Neomarinimicrobiota bacterium]